VIGMPRIQNPIWRVFSAQFPAAAPLRFETYQIHFSCIYKNLKTLGQALWCSIPTMRIMHLGTRNFQESLCLYIIFITMGKGLFPYICDARNRTKNFHIVQKEISWVRCWFKLFLPTTQLLFVCTRILCWL